MMFENTGDKAIQEIQLRATMEIQILQCLKTHQQHQMILLKKYMEIQIQLDEMQIQQSLKIHRQHYLRLHKSMYMLIQIFVLTCNFEQSQLMLTMYLNTMMFVPANTNTMMFENTGNSINGVQRGRRLNDIASAGQRC